MKKKPLRRKPLRFIKSIYVISALLLIASCTVVALIYFSPGSDAVFRANLLMEIAKSFLELAVIGIIGGFAKHLLDQAAERRASQRAKSTFQRDLYHKLLNINYSVRASRTRLRANHSATNYRRRLEQILRAKFDLHDLEKEVQNTLGLFAEGKKIVQGLQMMQRYLELLIREFESTEVNDTAVEPLPELKDFLDDSESAEYHKAYVDGYFLASDNLLKSYMRDVISGEAPAASANQSSGQTTSALTH
jgi:hypothetical protein